MAVSWGGAERSFGLGRRLASRAKSRVLGRPRKGEKKRPAAGPASSELVGVGRDSFHSLFSISALPIVPVDFRAQARRGSTVIRRFAELMAGLAGGVGDHRPSVEHRASSVERANIQTRTATKAKCTHARSGHAHARTHAGCLILRRIRQDVERTSGGTRRLRTSLSSRFSSPLAGSRRRCSVHRRGLHNFLPGLCVCAGGREDGGGKGGRGRVKMPDRQALGPKLR